MSTTLSKLVSSGRRMLERDGVKTFSIRDLAKASRVPRSTAYTYRRQLIAEFGPDILVARGRAPSSVGLLNRRLREAREKNKRLQRTIHALCNLHLSERLKRLETED